MEDEDLSCSVCLEIYRDPCTLPCGHTFCLSCIQDSLAATPLRRRCPLCNAAVPYGHHLKVSILARSLVQALVERNHRKERQQQEQQWKQSEQQQRQQATEATAVAAAAAVPHAQPAAAAVSRPSACTPPQVTAVGNQPASLAHPPAVSPPHRHPHQQQGRQQQQQQQPAQHPVLGPDQASSRRDAIAGAAGTAAVPAGQLESSALLVAAAGPIEAEQQQGQQEQLREEQQQQQQQQQQHQLQQAHIASSPPLSGEPATTSQQRQEDSTGASGSTTPGSSTTQLPPPRPRPLLPPPKLALLLLLQSAPGAAAEAVAAVAQLVLWVLCSPTAGALQDAAWVALAVMLPPALAVWGRAVLWALLAAITGLCLAASRQWKLLGLLLACAAAADAVGAPGVLWEAGSVRRRPPAAWPADL